MPTVELVHGGVKATAVRRVLADAKRIVIVSGFVTSKGLAEVRKPILECVKRGGRVTLLFGIDRAGIASPELVRELGAMLQMAGESLDVSMVVEAGRTFLHAKIFAAAKRGTAEILVGSFNLTGGGLTSNHEFAARLTGSAGNFFDDLASFINSIPERRTLDVSNFEKLAEALSMPVGEPHDPEAAERRRKDAQQRLDSIIASLDKKANPIDEGQVASRLDTLLRSGSFWTYQFDIEKLSVQSGLSAIYDQGLLRKEKEHVAGTAKVKVATGVSASFPLLPTTWQGLFRRLSIRTSKAVSAFGFETPYGYWVPHVLLESLQARMHGIASALPSGDTMEKDVRKHVDKHKEQLAETIDEILASATKSGLQPPSRWKAVRDKELAAIRARFETIDDDGWSGSDGEKAALEIIRKRLMAVAEKLDAELAIAKLRRIRPQLHSVPMEQTDTVVRHLLECIVWAVAEDRGVRASRPVVRALSKSLDVRKALPTLQPLSEALLEEADGAERMFFRVFGDPPYWGKTDSSDDDADEEGD